MLKNSYRSLVLNILVIIQTSQKYPPIDAFTPHLHTDLNDSFNNQNNVLITNPLIMKNSSYLLNNSIRNLLLFTALILLSPLTGFCQETASTKLEKMPPDLERDFALSALPPHLRKEATVYLLDPAKGYYIAKKGTNGFICYIERTAWEWGEFRNDVAAPISYDAEGARKIFTVTMDVAAMRASGKYTAKQ